MKLVLKKRHARQVARVLKLNSRKATSREKLRYKRRKIPWRGQRQTSRLSVPHALAVGGDQNRKTLNRFFAKLRELSLERRLRVILDFSDTKVTLVTGTLLFIAELDRIKRILKDDFSVGIDGVRDKRVNQLLCQIGLYALCDVAQPSLSEELLDPTVRHWRYATGERVNEQTNKAFESFEGRLSPELAKGMWKSVSEAVVNSVEHAYLEPRGVNGPRMHSSRWWMFSQEKEGQLTVAVCDLGIGIPRSLPIRWEPSLLARVFNSLRGEGPDLRAIRAALRVGASSTGGDHRGNGLPQIWNTLQSAQNASIQILSNRAQLSWNGAVKKEFALEFTESIFGTIIIWTVDVNEPTHEG